MIKTALLENFKKYYEKACVFPQQMDVKEIEKFSSIVSHKQSYKILDMGCAEGKLSIFFAEKGHNVTAADISENQLKIVRNNLKKTKIKLTTIACDIEETREPFKDQKFDYIFFMDIIEHLRSPIKAIMNIRDLLKEDGQLIIHTPNSCMFSRFFRYALRPIKKDNNFDPENLGDLHLQEYNYISLEKLLNFSGLKIIQPVPTNLSIPIFDKFYLFHSVERVLAKFFPFLSDTLLVICEKTDPINIETLFASWKNRYPVQNMPTLY